MTTLKNRIFMAVLAVLLVSVVLVAGKTPITSASSASSMLVLERDTGRILYEQNAYQARPMASTTKVVTAITVIETVDDLSLTVAIPKEAAGIEGSSIYLQAGEKLTYLDLLYGLMLQSGNDCAAALAILSAGSIEAFAQRMNELAKKAGAESSNFVNPHGLHHDLHYTTAHDLARISAYAMKNETFRTIVSTKRYTMPWEGRDYDRVINNKNKLLFRMEDANGIKTGFTKKAGRCLVASAERNGMTVIAVVLNCGPMFEECEALLKRAFSEYRLIDIAELTEHMCEVAEGKSDTVMLRHDQSIFTCLRKEEALRLRVEYEITAPMTAPVKNGKENGFAKVLLDNRELYRVQLYTTHEVEGYTVGDKLKDLVGEW